MEMKTGRAKMRRNRMWAVFLSAVLLAGSFSFSYGDSGESGTALDGEFLPDIETEDQKRVTAGSVITESGEYYLDSRASEGTVFIRTSEPVTIVGSGIKYGGNDYLTISCEKENADLTIRELRIDNATEMPANALVFTGKGNRLTLEGQNSLQQCYNDNLGKSIINVDGDTELTIGGSGELYMYKHSYYNAAIGGNEHQESGTVIIEGGHLRIMGINGGALIGSDTSAGDVYIRGGDVALWADSGQTAIGGYGDADGNDISVSGGTLSVTGGGTLIGGGKGADQHGTLQIAGGYVYLEDLSKVKAGIFSDGAPASVCTFDLSEIQPKDGVYSVKVDGLDYYTGETSFCTYDIGSVVESASSPDTWKMNDEKKIDLYLTEKDHTVAINDQTYLVKFNEGAGFEISDQDSGGGEIGGADSGESSGGSGSEGGSSGGGSGSSGGGAVEKPEDSGTDETVTEDGEDAYIPVKSAEDFSDVGQNDWFFEAVDRVCGLGLMTGVTDTEFSPESCMSRGMIATLLQRLDQAAEKGESSSEASMDVLPFSDVAADAWYAPSVGWAYENGIVNGISAGKFSPDGDVTREQTAALFYRYAESRNWVAVSGTSDADGDLQSKIFSDEEEISLWAEKAVLWAERSGIITGDNAGYFHPGKSIKRSEVAAMVCRFVQYAQSFQNS